MRLGTGVAITLQRRTGVAQQIVRQLLDTYTGAQSAWSTRLLRAGHTGPCLRVRRSSDNAEQDIGFSGVDLDETALTTFVGADSGFVTTWYDQSGLSRNATQTTAASQPLIVNAGTVSKVNGRVAVRFNGSSMSLNVQSSLGIVQNISELYAFAIVKTDAAPYAGVNGFIYSTTGASGSVTRAAVAVLNGASNVSGRVRRLDGDALTLPNAPAGITTLAAYTLAARYSINSATMFRNSVSGTAATIGGTAGPTPNTASEFAPAIGRFAPAADNFWLGEVSELIVYTTDQSGTRAAIESNQISYFGIT